MKGIVQKIIIAVVGLFFMFSACEISTSYFHNTFDDDYDCYIQPDNSQTIHIPIKIFTDLVVLFIPEVHEFHSIRISVFTILLPDYFHYSTPPLYIKNRVLLI